MSAFIGSLIKISVLTIWRKCQVSEVIVRCKMTQVLDNLAFIQIQVLFVFSEHFFTRARNCK